MVALRKREYFWAIICILPYWRLREFVPGYRTNAEGLNERLEQIYRVRCRWLGLLVVELHPRSRLWWQRVRDWRWDNNYRHWYFMHIHANAVLWNLHVTCDAGYRNAFKSIWQWKSAYLPLVQGHWQVAKDRIQLWLLLAWDAPRWLCDHLGLQLLHLYTALGLWHVDSRQLIPARILLNLWHAEKQVRIRRARQFIKESPTIWSSIPAHDKTHQA